MTVYLIHRSTYIVPLGRSVKTFRDESLFAWFKRNWATKADAVEYYGDGEWNDWGDRTRRITGTGWIYGFNRIWDQMAMRDPPASDQEWQEWLGSFDYPESGPIHTNGHALQVRTDDDEFDQAILMFDSHYLEANPEITEFLLYKKQRLPVRVKKNVDPFNWNGDHRVLGRPGEGEGSVFVALMTAEGSELTQGVFRFKGVQMPGLVEYLRGPQPKLEDKKEYWTSPAVWPAELRMLRWFAISSDQGTPTQDVFDAMLAANPWTNAHLYYKYNSRAKDQGAGFLMGDEKSCRKDFQTIEKHLAERAEKFAKREQKFVAYQDSKPKSNTTYIQHEDFVQNEKHLFQVGFRRESILNSRGPSHFDNATGAIYVFDDVWAASYPDLAGSLLNCGTRLLPLF